MTKISFAALVVLGVALLTAGCSHSEENYNGGGTTPARGTPNPSTPSSGNDRAGTGTNGSGLNGTTSTGG